jgi:hypothetical protein
MSFYVFRLLSLAMQLSWVGKHGTYLVQRWEDKGGINLFYCADAGRGLVM